MLCCAPGKRPSGIRDLHRSRPRHAGGHPLPTAESVPADVGLSRLTRTPCQFSRAATCSMWSTCRCRGSRDIPCGLCAKQPARIRRRGGGGSKRNPNRCPVNFGLGRFGIGPRALPRSRRFPIPATTPSMVRGNQAVGKATALVMAGGRPQPPPRKVPTLPPPETNLQIRLLSEFGCVFRTYQTEAACTPASTMKAVHSLSSNEVLAAVVGRLPPCNSEPCRPLLLRRCASRTRGRAAVPQGLQTAVYASQKHASPNRGWGVSASP